VKGVSSACTSSTNLAWQIHIHWFASFWWANLAPKSNTCKA